MTVASALSSGWSELRVTTQQATSSNATSESEDRDYYHRMRRLASLHLQWVLPVIAFLVITCCMMWWCVSSHTMHDEKEELFLAAQTHEQKYKGQEGFITVIADDEVEEASVRLRQQREAAKKHG